MLCSDQTRVTECTQFEVRLSSILQTVLTSAAVITLPIGPLICKIALALALASSRSGQSGQLTFEPEGDAAGHIYGHMTIGGGFFQYS